MSPLRIIAVFHPRERLQKCTLHPLLPRPDVVACTFPDMEDLDLRGAVTLAPDGPPLGRGEGAEALVLVDGTWRYARRIARSLGLPRRSLPGFVTAYPRTSKLFRDPAGGLASAEALYAAKLVLGEEDPSLLDGYRWAEEFLALNRRRIEELRAAAENS
jgi:pre-rRNA-processing protein TSR3